MKSAAPENERELKIALSDLEEYVVIYIEHYTATIFLLANAQFRGFMNLNPKHIANIQAEE